MLRHVTPLTHKGLIFTPTFVLDFCQGQAVVFAGVKIDGQILNFCCSLARGAVYVGIPRYNAR